MEVKEFIGKFAASAANVFQAAHENPEKLKDALEEHVKEIGAAKVAKKAGK